MCVYVCVRARACVRVCISGHQGTIIICCCSLSLSLPSLFLSLPPPFFLSQAIKELSSLRQQMQREHATGMASAQPGAITAPASSGAPAPALQAVLSRSPRRCWCLAVAMSASAVLVLTAVCFAPVSVPSLPHIALVGGGNNDTSISDGQRNGGQDPYLHHTQGGGRLLRQADTTTHVAVASRGSSAGSGSCLKRADDSTSSRGQPHHGTAFKTRMKPSSKHPAKRAAALGRLLQMDGLTVNLLYSTPLTFAGLYLCIMPEPRVKALLGSVRTLAGGVAVWCRRALLNLPANGVPAGLSIVVPVAVASLAALVTFGRDLQSALNTPRFIGARAIALALRTTLPAGKEQARKVGVAADGSVGRRGRREE